MDNLYIILDINSYSFPSFSLFIVSQPRKNIYKTNISAVRSTICVAEKAEIRGISGRSTIKQCSKGAGMYNIIL